MQQTAELTLEQFLDNLYAEKRMTNSTTQRIMSSIEAFIKMLKGVNFQRAGLSRVDYQYFGSFSNGFGTQSSDVDFTIVTNSYVSETQVLAYVKKEFDKLNNKRFKIKSTILRARIPVLVFEDTELQIDYDFCCNNVLGVVNTRLLYSYSQLHPIVQKGGVLLKVWGKTQKLIGQNHFSSYAIILMWIAFLQRKHNLPNLQDPEYLKRFPVKDSLLKIERKTMHDAKVPNDRFEVNCRFITDKDEIAKRMTRFTDGALSDLLKEFWSFYKKDGEFEKSKKVISIHLNSLEDRKQNDVFKMLDPFDLKHDPGHRVRNLELQQWEKFETSQVLLAKKHSLDSLF